MCLINAEIKPYTHQRLGGGDVRFIFHRNEYANKLQILASLDEYIALTPFALFWGTWLFLRIDTHRAHVVFYLLFMGR